MNLFKKLIVDACIELIQERHFYDANLLRLETSPKIEWLFKRKEFLQLTNFHKQLIVQKMLACFKAQERAFYLYVSIFMCIFTFAVGSLSFISSFFWDFLYGNFLGKPIESTPSFLGLRNATFVFMVLSMVVFLIFLCQDMISGILKNHFDVDLTELLNQQNKGDFHDLDRRSALIQASALILATVTAFLFGSLFYYGQLIDSDSNFIGHLNSVTTFGMLFVVFSFLLVSIPIFLVASSFVLQLIFPENYFIDRLISISMNLDQSFGSSSRKISGILLNQTTKTHIGRKRLASYIEDLAPILRKCISNINKDPRESIYYQHIQDHIIKDFKSLKRWIYTPKADTDEYLQKRLLEYVRVVATGDIDALLVNYSEPEEVLKPRATAIFYVKRYSNLIIRAVIPFVIILLADRFLPGFNEQIHGYAMAGAIVFAAIILLGELDPNIEERIKFAQDSILAFLSRSK